MLPTATPSVGSDSDDSPDRSRSILRQVQPNGVPADNAAIGEPTMANLTVAIELYKRLREHGIASMPDFHSSTRGLGPRSLLHDRKEVWFAFRTTAAALELGSLFNRERHVMDVTINLR